MDKHRTYIGYAWTLTQVPTRTEEEDRVLEELSRTIPAGTHYMRDGLRRARLMRLKAMRKFHMRRSILADAVNAPYHKARNKRKK